MKTIYAFIAVLILSAPAAFGQCSDADLAKRAAAERRTRAAKPESLQYVPKPFATTTDAVIENYRHSILELWGKRKPSQLSAEQLALVEGLRAASVDLKVSRVENWGIRRCGDPLSGDFYHLVQVFDRATRRELARAALFPSGKPEQTGFVTAADRPLISTASAMSETRGRFGVSAQSATLITSTGTLRCDVLMPCAAMRSGATTYVSTPEGELYEIPAQGRRLSYRAELATPEQRQKHERTLQPSTERVMSLGGDVFVARKRNPIR